MPKECTDAHMKQMDAMIAKMTKAAKKKEATTALDMSKAEMKKDRRLHEVHEGGLEPHLWGPVVAAGQHVDFGSVDARGGD
jgi:hypothetical protein